jgi:hypothetical protein
MKFVVDARWLLLLPIGSIVVFVSWVLWNLSREIWAERRRRVRTYRVSEVKIYFPASRSEAAYSSRRDARKRVT